MTALLRNRRRAVLAACCAALVGVAAGCGGGSSSGVPKGDIALVAGQPITTTLFDKTIDEYNRSAKAAGQATVKCCDQAYKNAVQQKIVPYLVQRAEFEQQAKKLGVSVTSKDVDDAIDKIVKQYYHGKKSEFLAAVSKQKATLAEVRDQVGLQVLQQKVTQKLTAGITVTDKEALDYYNKNKSQYVTPTSRDLAHILVKTKALATKIYNQLRGGADFAKLAKKYSTDKSSGVQGGKLGVQPKSGLVKAFADPAFALKTGTISKPVHSQYGWHIIKALGPVIPESTSPFSKEKAAIKQQLKQAKESSATSAWQSRINAYYKNRVKYASSLYEPPKATSAAPPATSLTPTG